MQKLRERMARDEGFTLIELLVVMLIIAILAALAIPSFFNQRNKAFDADAKADVRTAQTAIETYSTDNNGSYTGATSAGMVAIEPTLSNANLTLSGITASAYTITVRARNTNTDFSVSRNGTTGAFTYTCSNQGSGGCPAGGNWGG
jgi:type IV pilus assembly protein PilA